MNGVDVMSDRRAGKRNAPHFGKMPRTRTKLGRWRKKRSDAGKPATHRYSKGILSSFRSMFRGLFSIPKNPNPYKADRRVGNKVPHVRNVPRSRTKAGRWRRKRSDAKNNLKRT